MPKKEIVQIGNEEDNNKKDVIVKELTVGQVMSLIETSDEDKGKSIVNLVQKKMGLVIDLKWEELKEYTPSDLKKVWEKIKEVNKDFFDISASLKFDRAINSMVEVVTNQFQELFKNSFVNLSKKDTEEKT